MKRLVDYKSRFRILKGGKISLIVSAFLGGATLSFAAPSGGVVTSGNANISQNGAVTDITQNSNKATINWQDFSIKSNETVNFKQPNASSITLNRVVGNEKSVIDGALNANGQIWILNSNGILFSKNAKVNTAGLLATTAELSDEDFNLGNYDFKNASSESVINLGTIEVSNSGSVVLASNEVKNAGSIKAVRGKVHLVGASDYRVNLNGNSLVNLKVNKGVLDALVENSGTVIADGGEVYFTTNAVNELLKGVVNNTGVVEANSVDDLFGKVEMFAHGGTANISGEIKAESNTSTDGGFIETSGKTVNIDEDIKISTKSKDGKTGTWLIDPVNIEVTSSGSDSTSGTSISGDTISTALNTTNVTLDTTTATGASTGEDDGNITINDTIEKTGSSATTLTLKANKDININKSISSTNGRLNVVLNADIDSNNTGDINFGAEGSISTNDGNFYVGSVSGTYDTVTASGEKFTMSTGSFIDVGAGNIDIKVNDDITLADNSAATDSPTYSLNKSQLYIDNYYRYFNSGNIYYYYQISSQDDLILSSANGSIIGGSTDSSIADIVTPSDVRLIAKGEIGTSVNPIKIQGSQTAGRNNREESSSYRLSSYGRTLNITNTLGNTYLSEINKQIFRSIDLTVSSSTTGTQSINIMDDANSTGAGHVLANVTNGNMLVQTDGVITKGDDSNNYAFSETVKSVFPTSVSLTASNIELENNAMLTKNYYSPSFSLYATNIVSSDSAKFDNISEISGAYSIYLRGTNVGTITNPLEVDSENSLVLNNDGGSSYLANSDYSSLSFTGYGNRVGKHSVLSSNGDFFNLTTTGEDLLVSTISGSTDGENFNNSSGTNLGSTYDKLNNTGSSRSLTIRSYDGNIILGEDSVNTGKSSFTAINNSADSSIKAQDLYDSENPVKQITAGSVNFINYSNDANQGIGNDGYDIQIEKGSYDSQNDTLSVDLYSGGNVSIHELSENHFDDTNITLQSSNKAQSINVDYANGDALNIVDDGSLIVLDSDKVKLSNGNKSFNFTAYSRNIQIGTKSTDGFSGNSLSTGNYYVRGSKLTLDGDILTNGGSINLYGSSGIELMRSINIDSNADDMSNSTSTGNSGRIDTYGTISSVGENANSLVIDSSSSDSSGNYIYLNSELSNNAGSFLKDLTLTSKGNTDTNDGLIYLYRNIYLNGDFKSTGDTRIKTSNFTIDTEQGNVADAGDIIFSGRNFQTYAWGDTTFDTSTTAVGKNGGNVVLSDTYYKSNLSTKSININTAGGEDAQAGDISLPGIYTTHNDENGTQTYNGKIITLYGNLYTNQADISLTGDVQLANSVQIDTWSDTNNKQNASAGDVTIDGGLSATKEDLTLNINTSTNTGNDDFNTSDGTTHELSDYYSHNAGDVSIVSSTTSGTNQLNTLIVDSYNQGSFDNGEDGSISLDGISTKGNQSYTAGAVNINGDLNAEDILVETKTANSTVGATGTITANSLELIGNNTTYNLAPTAGHNLNELAVSSASSVNLLNTKALNIKTISSTEGISASGTIDIATKTGDITVDSNIETTLGYSNAIVLNAGKDSSAGTKTGGNIVVNNNSTITAGEDSRVKLFSGSIEGSLGLSNIISKGNSRYNSDESASNFTASLGEDTYAIYREQPILKVSAEEQEVTYGQSVPTEYSASYSGFVNGDTADELGATGTASFTTDSGSVSSSGYRVVGDYDVTYNSGLSNALGYAFEDNSEQTGELSITKKELSVSGIIASNKTYDATTNASLSNEGSLSGVLGEDSVSFTSNANFADKNVGEDKTVSLNFALNGEDSSNYSLTDSGSVSATITAKDITVSAVAQDKIYDGGINASTTLSSNGLIGEDSVSFNGSSYFTDKNVGEDKTVTVSSLGKSGEDADNYNITNNTASTTATITAKDITVSAVAQDKIYDGGINASTTLSSSGVIGEDSVSFSGSSYFSDKNVGEDKAVTVSSLGKSGEDAGNYNIVNTTATTNADINLRDITIVAGSKSKIFGNPEVDLGVSVDLSKGLGLASTDSLSDVTGTLSREEGEATGSYDIYLGNGVESSNYNITYNKDNDKYVIIPKAPEFVAVTPPNAPEVKINIDTNIVSKPELEQLVTELITLTQIKQEQTNNNTANNTPVNPDVKVPLSNNSIVELVNGGVSLPEGVDQVFFVVGNQTFLVKDSEK